MHGDEFASLFAPDPSCLQAATERRHNNYSLLSRIQWYHHGLPRYGLGFRLVFVGYALAYIGFLGPIKSQELVRL